MNGIMTIHLHWNSLFPANKRKVFAKVQDYVDRQCLVRMTPYVPVGLPRFTHAGRLRDSGKISKPGCIVYTAPFARNDYYAHKNHQNGGNPAATRLWFETMKAHHAGAIRSGAQKLIGGRAWM